MLKKFLVLILIFYAFLKMNLYSQDYSINNIRYKMDGKEIIINYDLSGQDIEYSLKLVLRKKGSSNFYYSPKNLSGDIGKGFFMGNDREIIWDISKEFPNSFISNDFYFELTNDPNAIPVYKTSSFSSNKYFWIATGAVVVGGSIATYFLLKKKSTPVEVFPFPPTRP